MKQSVLDLQININNILGSAALNATLNNGELTIELSPHNALENFNLLKNELKFDLLIDICGIDYLSYGQTNWESKKAVNQGFSRGIFDFAEEEVDADLLKPRRFASVYHLLSVEKNIRLRVKVFPEDTSMPIVPSVVSVWSCSDWFERESFDLYGIIYEGHPDLRRILTDYGFIGHPLRKDFPLVGEVEMRYDNEKGRVVYSPVEIENRVNVPRVIREDKIAKNDNAEQDA
jgi:NADH-quinone oxidoreductase subunit C